MQNLGDFQNSVTQINLAVGLEMTEFYTYYTTYIETTFPQKKDICKIVFSAALLIS